MSIFSSIGSFISNFFSKAVPAVETAFTSANSVVNIIKTFLGSATGQTLEAIIEAFAPGVSNAIFTALNLFFKDYGIIQSDLTGTPAEIAAKGLNTIATLTGSSKIIGLSNVAAIIGHEISSAAGGGSTLQQAIVAAPVVYNPSVLNIAPTTSVLPPSTATPEAPITNYTPTANVAAPAESTGEPG